MLPREFSLGVISTDLNDSAVPSNDLPLTTPVPQRLQVVTEVKKSKILIATLPEMGHLNPVLNLGRELALRGHEVTLATCAFLSSKVTKQCGEAGIAFVGLAPELISPESPGSPLENVKSTLMLYAAYNRAMQSCLRAEVAKIHPTVILADFMTTCAFEVGDECSIPVAVNFADPVLLNLAGPSPSPLFALSFAVLGPLTFGGGLTAGPSYAKLIGHIFKCIWCRLCLVNSFWGMQPVSCMPPNVVFIGPTVVRSESELMDTSLQELNDWLAWVRQQKLRIVYVTFGSMVKLTAVQVSRIYDGLAAIPGVAVAWSLKEAGQKHLPEQLPKHFFVHHWFPQAEIVRVPEVAAVITHCGWGGLMEIVMAGKPIVGVPFIGDQPSNAQMAKQHGFGEVVLPKRLTAAAVRHAVERVMEGQAYHKSAQKMKAALLSSGGATSGAMQVEFLATFDVDHQVRRPPTLCEDVAKKTLTALLVGGALVAFTDHMRRIFKGRK